MSLIGNMCPSPLFSLSFFKKHFSMLAEFLISLHLLCEEEKERIIEREYSSVI